MGRKVKNTKGLAILAIIGLIIGCAPKIEKAGVTFSPKNTTGGLSPPPTAPGAYKNSVYGVSISFPENLTAPKMLESREQLFHVAGERGLPVCQLFVSDISGGEALEPESAKIWMAEKMFKKGFRETEIVRAETVQLESGIDALFITAKLKWQDSYYWGAYIIVDRNKSRFTVFSIDDGRLDRSETTVMSLRLLD